MHCARKELLFPVQRAIGLEVINPSFLILAGLHEQCPLSSTCMTLLTMRTFILVVEMICLFDHMEWRYRGRCFRVKGQPAPP